MKQCRNNNCKHELEDNQNRCPYCGWTQNTKALFKENSETDNCEKNGEQLVEIKERNAFVTVWIYLAIVSNFFSVYGRLISEMGLGSRFS